MNTTALIRILEDKGFRTEEVEGGTELLISCPLCFDEGNRLYINADSGLWICFHCHERGHLIRLLTDLCEYTIAKAVEIERDLQGPVKRRLPLLPSVAPPPIHIDLPSGFQCLDMSKESQKTVAWEYLQGRIDMNLVRTYGIGYCLVGKYARRVVVPVYTQNELRTFVARTWDNRVPPALKVLNADNSAAERALFNYDFIPSQADPVYVVEGVFDALRMIGYGFKHTVATLGAHLTDQQRRLLKRKGITRVILLRDGDTPGQEAALTEAQELQAAFFDVSIAMMPEGTDPSSVPFEVVEQAIQKAKPANLQYGVEVLREEVQQNG